MSQIIKISELKVNDQLADEYPSIYGQYINRSVDSIRITKAGRFVIKIKKQYNSIEKGLHDFQIMNFSNGAVVGTNEITLK